MKIECLQVEPVIVVSISDFTQQEIVDYLFCDNLPVEMSVDIAGNLFHFYTKTERMQFALGYQLSWQLSKMETNQSSMSSV